MSGHGETSVPEILKALPQQCSPYKRTAEFSETSVPRGLLIAHRTKTGTWGKIIVLDGQLRYRILEPEVTDVVLSPDKFGVVEPGVLHEVLPVGNVLFYVEFWR